MYICAGMYVCMCVCGVICRVHKLVPQVEVEHDEVHSSTLPIPGTFPADIIPASQHPYIPEDLLVLACMLD